MLIGLLVFTILGSLYSAIEISIPHHFQALLISLKSDSDDLLEPSKFDIIMAFSPLIHIPFIILLFLSNISRFTYFGIYFLFSFIIVEGVLIRWTIKKREVITTKAALDLLIQVDIIRSIIMMG